MRRQHADRGDVERAAEGDAREHAVDVLGRRLARADAGDEAACFFMLSATSTGLNVTAV